MKIKNIDQMRDDALDTLEKLSKGKISVHEANVVAKLYQNVMSTVKAQIQVAAMLNREPNIPFLGNTGKGKLLPMEHNAEVARIAKES